MNWLSTSTRTFESFFSLLCPLRWIPPFPFVNLQKEAVQTLLRFSIPPCTSTKGDSPNPATFLHSHLYVYKWRQSELPQLHQTGRVRKSQKTMMKSTAKSNLFKSINLSSSSQEKPCTSYRHWESPLCTISSQRTRTSVPLLEQPGIHPPFRAR